MANSLYLGFKQEALGDAAGSGHGVANLETATLKLVLCDSADYTANVNTNQDQADIPSGARVATGTLAGKTITVASNTATFDASDLTLTAVSGDQSEVMVIYKDSGVEATSLLIVFFDTFTSGMPVTPNGGDVQVVFNASGIFSW